MVIEIENGIYDYISEVLKCYDFEKDRVLGLNSLGEFEKLLLENKLDEEDFYFIEGQYLYQPPSSAVISIDSGNLVVENENNEPGFLSDRKKTNLFVNLAKILEEIHPLLYLPLVENEGVVSSEPFILTDLLLTYENHSEPKVTLVGSYSYEGISNSSRISLIPRPN